MSDFFKMFFVDIIQIGISIATLFIAWVVVKKLVPGELKKKQLEAVLDLVQHLNSYTFTMHHMRFSGAELNPSFVYLKRNVFEYRRAYNKANDAKPISSCKILLLSDITQPLDLSRFIENPLLPSVIVPFLAPFISMAIPKFKDKLDTQDIVIVFDEFMKITSGEIKKEMLFNGIAGALASHGEFLDAINNLIKAIEKWCDANGLKDLNFREHNSRSLNV